MSSNNKRGRGALSIKKIRIIIAFIEKRLLMYVTRLRISILPEKLVIVYILKRVMTWSIDMFDGSRKK